MMNGFRFGSGIINLFGLIKVVIVLLVIIVLALVFLGLPMAVSGHSMEPNFVTGQIVLEQRVNFSTAKLQRGDVVAARFPADPNHTKLIKRVIGLPGDTVSSDSQGHLFVNGQELTETAYGPHYGAIPYQPLPAVTLGPNEYFLAGDNRPASSDSRVWGPVQSSDIEGRIAFVAWPFSDAKYVGHISY